MGSGAAGGQGCLITVEGIDGAGKSTQVRLLATFLSARGYRTVTTREPGATPLGQEVRRLLLETAIDLSPNAELLLLLADRAEHVKRVIKPALAAGAIVLSDRFSDSTLAYQGYGRQACLDRVRRLDAESRDGVAADLTILLDCPIALAAGRRQRGRDRYQELDPAFHQRVRDGFLALAEAAPDHIRRIDASRDLNAVSSEVIRTTLAWLEERSAG